MTNQNVEIIKTWKTLGGLDVTLTGILRLSKIVNLDGDRYPVDCCELDVDVKVSTKGHQGDRVTPLPKGHGALALGRTHIVGELALTQEQADLIASVKSELASHPAWIAKQAKIAKNQAEIAAAESRRGPGYCHKCHSYCYGDCQAN